ncbi:hypothetical protein, partial [Klebsiella quasipneumoniae]|uniref:hypothetical protein n=1 Tax=Klebsiella quasipneumoniae TaxID=1463165 RepID=UPI001CCF2CA9
ITLLISRLFHCAAKCRIIQQEYDTKTSKMFQSSHKMFQFVNAAELFFTPKWPGKYALIIKKIIYPFKINTIYKTKPIALNGKTK